MKGKVIGMKTMIEKNSETKCKPKINAAKPKPITERIIKTVVSLVVAGQISIASPGGSMAAGNSAKFTQPMNGAGTYLEVSTSYNLPGSIKGSTTVDLCDTGGFFGGTSLEKPVSGGLNARLQMDHSNDLFTRAGMGARAVISSTKRIFAKVGATPVWSDGSGIVKNLSTLNYLVIISLPKGFSILNYGEWNLAAQGGPKWTYGEVNVTKQIGRVKVGYNPALLGDGDAMPSIQHMLSVEMEF
jgi:hypothetical protein